MLLRPALSAAASQPLILMGFFPGLSWVIFIPFHMHPNRRRIASVRVRAAAALTGGCTWTLCAFRLFLSSGKL